MKSIFTISFILLALLGQVSATSIRAEQIEITHSNKGDFKIDSSYKNKTENEICITVNAPRKYKNDNQLGLYIELKNENQNVIFNGAVSAVVDDDENMVKYSFCTNNNINITFAFIPYGYFNNGLVTAYLDISALLK